MNKILLAFDFGLKSIGVAVGQTVTNTAQPLNAVKAKNGVPQWKIIDKLLDYWNPKKIIVGYPINIDGTEQSMTAKARHFSGIIFEYYKVEVLLHDERLTTIESRSELFDTKKSKGLKKGAIDSVSAAIILESFLREKRTYHDERVYQTS